MGRAAEDGIGIPDEPDAARVRRRGSAIVCLFEERRGKLIDATRALGVEECASRGLLGCRWVCGG